MKTFTELQEGVYDPNILKAFFLAGGPGSGKSYVVRKTTGGLGMKIVNSDVHFERLLKQAGLSQKMPPEEEERRNVQRDRAKRITKAQQSNYLEGRLGLIIDGTGKDYDKIAKNMRDLQQLGYDCYMVFVNTSLDTALQRNKERDRTVPEPIVVQSWKAVQSNLGKFSQLFKRNLVIVDNNEVGEDLMNPVFKQVRGLAKTKVQNGIGRQWIANELAKKAR